MSFKEYVTEKEEKVDLFKLQVGLKHLFTKTLTKDVYEVLKPIFFDGSITDTYKFSDLVDIFNEKVYGEDNSNKKSIKVNLYNTLIHFEEFMKNLKKLNKDLKKDPDQATEEE